MVGHLNIHNISILFLTGTYSIIKTKVRVSAFDRQIPQIQYTLDSR